MDQEIMREAQLEDSNVEPFPSEIFTVSFEIVSDKSLLCNV